MKISHYILLLCITMTIMAAHSSCTTSDTYQRQSATHEGKWAIRDAKSFKINIDDTTRPYQLHLLLRNDDAYPYENIWIKLAIQSPQDSTYKDSALVNCKLADLEGNWLGNSRGSMYDHIIKLQAPSLKNFGTRKGVYNVKVTQMMRQDPINGIHNVGIRVTK